MEIAVIAAERFFVYVHSRLFTGEPFYVGKGHGRRHKVSSRNNRHWNNIVAKDGGFHSTLVASGIDEEFSFLLEIEVIDKYRRAGVVLANRTLGGGGVAGMRHTPESKARIGAASKGNQYALGKKLSAEARAKIGEASRGNKHVAGYRHTPEALAKIAAASTAAMAGNKLWLGKSHSPETKAKLSAARMGNTYSSSPEAREKIAAANHGNQNSLGFKHSAAARANMSAAHKGKPSARKGQKASEQTRARLREAWVRRLARKASQWTA